ncbi:hypothetical protein C2S52_014373 [Perilla frutescens var. hirtella]|nr:hypothetical protein C2S52_014373 [Perilla frutescens var. hirtella]KAH6816763.1 hypothetical protein C2S51_021583 [Perilla frutescens var. frutescens]
MKTSVLVVFLSSVLILATVQGQAKASDLVKNRRLLSDWGRTYSADPRRETVTTTNVVDGEAESSPENNTHHVLILIMKTTVLVVFLASILILATFQDQVEASGDPIKNRRLLSDVGRSYSAAPRWETAKAGNVVDDGDESSPENSTHHVFTNQLPPSKP